MAIDFTLRPTKADDPELCTFLERETDPVRDLLAWADARPPLGEHSRIWLACAQEGPVGVAVAFPLWPERPALVVRGLDAGVEQRILDMLVRSGALACGYVINEPAQVPLYARFGQVGDCYTEWHYTLSAADCPRASFAEIVHPSLPALDAFYRRVGAAAWNPLQFETGPYVGIEVDGRLVAAAGTHFRYPQLAQIGNVATDPACRGRGLARRCTAALAQFLVDEGAATLSLFVAEENATARRLYESLGFRPLRPLAAFAWDALTPS